MSKIVASQDPPSRPIVREFADLEAIMRKNNQGLFRLARSIVRDDGEAEDIVQATYITAYFKREQFAGASWAGWLRRITTNRALDRLRQMKREQQVKDAARDVDLGWRVGAMFSRTPEDAVAHRQLAGVIERAIDALPDAQRCVFVMREVQGLTAADTASCLGIDEGAVRVRLHRARAQLKQWLGPSAQGRYVDTFSFDGQRCDRIVERTLASLAVALQNGVHAAG